MSDKPLFVPLKTEFYEAFRDGEKKFEYRKYGKQWTEKHCRIGRPAVLAKGYGWPRLLANTKSFRRASGHEMPERWHRAIVDIFGGLDVDMCEIGFEVHGEHFND